MQIQSSHPQLVIGNKNYSSWSLRAWLLMRRAGIAFEEKRIALYTSQASTQISSLSPSGKVPLLIDGTILVWDSLAIAEYLAEQHPRLHLWPPSAAARAHARAICAEMHSGLAQIRSHMPMNCRRSPSGRERPPEVVKEIARVELIFNDCRARYYRNGPFLFGNFSIADAMYAPVVLRFETYDVALHGSAANYAALMRALPEVQEWVEAARAESEIIAKFELA